MLEFKTVDSNYFIFSFLFYFYFLGLRVIVNMTLLSHCYKLSHNVTRCHTSVA